MVNPDAGRYAISFLNFCFEIGSTVNCVFTFFLILVALVDIMKNPLNIYFCIVSTFILGCTSTSERQLSPSEVDFMFNDHEERNFDYPYGEDPEYIIESILSRSVELGIDVKGITAMAWGFHPVAYVIYTEEKADVSFFYWGNTAGKGYIEGFTFSELEEMNTAVYSDESCAPYSRENIDWLDIHVFKKNSGYVICNEGGAFFGGGKIRGYFDKRFNERINWVEYSYGK